MKNAPPEDRNSWLSQAEDLHEMFTERLDVAKTDLPTPQLRQSVLELWMGCVLFRQGALLFPDENLFDRPPQDFFEHLQTRQDFFWHFKFPPIPFRELGFSEHNDAIFTHMKQFMLHDLPAVFGYDPDYLRRPPDNEKWKSYCSRFIAERGQPPGAYTSTSAVEAMLAFARHRSTFIIYGQESKALNLKPFTNNRFLIQIEDDINRPLAIKTEDAISSSERRVKLLENFWRRAEGCFNRTAEEHLNYELDDLPINRLELLREVEIQRPSNIWLASFFLGGWGIDRILIGDAGMGIIKLLTGGGFGMLWLYDVLTITNRTRDRNYERVVRMLNSGK